MKGPALLNWLRRRFWGGYAIDDPRPIAERAPYTFHLPSENEVLALNVGDTAKLVIRSVPASTEWEAERMWVTVTAVDGNRMSGQLANTPSDIPQLKAGSIVHFDRHAVIDIEWKTDRSLPPPSAPDRRWYWERCLVDCCVTQDGVAVEYLYREAADAPDGDRFPDSGWRIRGDARDLSAEQIDSRQAEYVALGRVLNADDSWLYLIDEPPGSAFMRNWETGRFDPAC